MTLVAAILGGLTAVGCWLVVNGWRGGSAREAPPVRTLPEVDPRRVLSAVAAGFALLVLTRWPVACVAGPVGGWALYGMAAAKRTGGQAKPAALALWCEMLRDAVGTARGIEGVLATTSVAAPLPIRAEVRRMAARLDSDGLEPALAGLADDLGHPTADMVVAALRQSATAGGSQLRDVLRSLARSAHEDASSRTRIDVARERPRAAMRYAALIIGGFVVLLLVFSRSYLAPYSTPVGQVVLLVVGLYWTAGFWWMRRMGREEPAERFLAPSAPRELAP